MRFLVLQIIAELCKLYSLNRSEFPPNYICFCCYDSKHIIELALYLPGGLYFYNYPLLLNLNGVGGGSRPAHSLLDQSEIKGVKSI